jgi:hypothetical protein
VRLYAQLAALVGCGYAGHSWYEDHQKQKELLRMYEYTAEDLTRLGEKVLKDFEERGYTQIPISHIMALRTREVYWSFRHFMEFSAERHNLTETVYDRLSCYHLEPPKDGAPAEDYDPWHFDGGPGPRPKDKFRREMETLHRDMTFVGDKVMAALAATLKDKTLAEIAVDGRKRSECVFKYYPEETPVRPANCGRFGLLYILPSTTMMDSPLCRKTFEFYDRDRRKHVDLEDTAPDLVCYTVIPGIPLLRYTRQFKPGAWRVAAEKQFSHDGRKTLEYAYGTHVTVPPRWPSAPTDAAFNGPQDNFRRKRDPIRKTP